MTELVALIGLPLIAGVLILFIKKRRYAGITTLTFSLTSFIVSFQFINTVLRQGIQVYSFAGWDPPFAIVFVGDTLSSFLVSFSCLIFTAISVACLEKFETIFYSLLMFTFAGVNGSLLTGDLFNLFVWFEVMLISSYGLVAYSGGWSSVASFKYLAINVLGSSFMLLGIGGVYRVLGTLNFAHISSIGSSEMFSLLPPVLLLFFTFILKAGVFPLHFWVPEVYTASDPVISGILSGIVKKIGVYGVIRVSFFVFPFFSNLLSNLSILLGIVSLFFGGIVAYSENDFYRFLSFSSISQMGFMFFAIGLGTFQGLAAALIIVITHGLSKPLMFLLTGVIEENWGSSTIERLNGVSLISPFTSYSFLTAGLCLIGIPPLIGFFGKFSLFKATVTQPVYLLTAIAGSILTLLYISKIWVEVFWGESSNSVIDSKVFTKVSIAILVASVIIFGIFFPEIWELISKSVSASLNPESYVSTVLSD